jgi:hypothetical protein
MAASAPTCRQRALDRGPRLRLGFLGAWLFCCKIPRQCLLDFLGFPWILSSESRLFDGLRGVKARKFFHAVFFVALAGWNARPCGSAELVMGQASSTSDFLQEISYRHKLLSERFPLAAFIQKQLALELHAPGQGPVDHQIGPCRKTRSGAGEKYNAAADFLRLGHPPGRVQCERLLKDIG